MKECQKAYCKYVNQFFELNFRDIQRVLKELTLGVIPHARLTRSDDKKTLINYDSSIAL